MAGPPPAIVFTITADDCTDALRLNMRRYWAGRIGPKLVLAAVFAASVSAMVLSGGDPSVTWPAIGVMLGMVAVPLLAYRFRLPHQARWIHRQQKSLHRPVEASWDERGYTACTETVTSTIPWSDYYGWSADARVVMLLQSQILFQMVPRRALSDAQAADLLAHLERAGVRRI